jgi:hypothetical protein
LRGVIELTDPWSLSVFSYTAYSASSSAEMSGMSNGDKARKADAEHVANDKSEKLPLAYDSIINASIQPLDLASGTDPLPEGEAFKLGDLISEDGAVVYLIRRPG